MGNTAGIKPTIEFNVNTFELFGESQITYISLGASMLGIINGGVFYSSPVIGFNQVIGEDFGFEFGASYFRQYYYTQAVDRKKINSLYDLENYDAFGFNFGFREISGSSIFRINYTPFYRLDTKNLQTSFGISWGWGF